MENPRAFKLVSILDEFEGGRGRKSLIYTGPEGKPGGESRFPLSLSLFFLDNFVAYIATPSVLQEEGNRLSPSRFPLGPVYVN
jgi:hypothetical protein